VEPIVVASSRGPYRVIVGDGVLDDLDAVVRSVNPGGRRFAVTSMHVLEAHHDRMNRAILDAVRLAVDDGEDAKSLVAVERLLDALIAGGARRDSVVIAIGGGSIGDSAGFAASVLFRGIDLVHVPTTLLAQVDSSIGGKVAINHERGKNLIGSVWPPRAVVADTSLLRTLPAGEFRSGTFEALKSGVIGDETLFELAHGGFRDDAGALADVVRRAIRVKAAIVTEDEREGDRRRLLNYGHTVGHAIEAALGFGTVTHGDAIAWGMIGANALAVRRGLLADEVRKRIDDAIRGIAPAPARGADRARVLAAAGSDKKVTGAGRAMVLARRVGACEIVEDVTDEELRYAVDAALEG
jgi:3-dehydroquinate synthase